MKLARPVLEFFFANAIFSLRAGANDASPQVRGFCFDALGVCRLHIQSRAPAPTLNIQSIPALPTASATAMHDESPSAVAQPSLVMYNAHQRHPSTASVFKPESSAAFENVSSSAPQAVPLRAESSGLASFATAPMHMTELNRGVESLASAAFDAPTASVGSKRGRDALEHAAHSATASPTSEAAADAAASLKRPHTHSLHSFAASVSHDSAAEAAEAAASSVVIVNEEPDEAEEGASLWNL